MTNPGQPLIYRRLSGTTPLTALLAAVTIGSIVALVWLWQLNPTNGSIHYELAKASIQLLTVAVIGPLVALAVRIRDERREERLRRDAFLRSILDETVRAYHSVKRVRRLLEAETHGADRGPVTVDVYSKYLPELIDQQLQFESLLRLASLVERQLRNALPHLQASDISFQQSMKAVESYLNGIAEEYQQERGNMARELETPLRRLTALHDFIHDTQAFKEGVSKHVNNTVKLVGDALLAPT